MPTDRLTPRLEPVRSRWRALERDWQSVAVGAAVVAATAVLEIRVPW